MFFVFSIALAQQRRYCVAQTALRFGRWRGGASECRSPVEAGFFFRFQEELEATGQSRLLGELTFVTLQPVFRRPMLTRALRQFTAKLVVATLLNANSFLTARKGRTMKTTALLPLVLALVAGTAQAQQKMGDMKNMDMGGQKAMTGAQTTHKGIGVVQQLDTQAGSVTFAHEPVKSLNWPAMTMGFAVKDKALLDKLAVGKKVEFEFVKEGKGYTLTNVK